MRNQKNKMFTDNIPADADSQQMLDEGKRMGLSPEDLAGGEEEKKPLTPNPMEIIGQPKPEGEKKPEIKPKADEEEDGEPAVKKPDDTKKPEESEEGEDGGQPSPESNKPVTQGQLGKITRTLKKEMNDNFAKLSETLKTFSAAKTPEKKEEAAAAVADQVDEIKVYAEKNKLDPEALKELMGLVEKSIMAKIPLDQLESLNQVAPVVQEMSVAMKNEQIISDFNQEYDSFQPTLAQQFPNATPEQWKKAKLLLRELATGPDYGYVEGKHDAYPLNHIVAIEAQKIKDALFSPKKKTAETGGMGEGGNEGETEDLTSTSYEQMTPKKAAAITDMLNDDKDYED